MVYTDSRPTSVYRYYDRDGLLIYVGITNRGIGRNREHNGSKVWWQYVARQDVEHYADRESALAAEKALIQRHKPPFNTVHNPQSEALRAAYMKYVGLADQLDETDPRRLASQLRRQLPLVRFADMDGLAVFRTLAEHSPITDVMTLPPVDRVPCDGARNVVRIDRGPRFLLFGVPLKNYPDENDGVLGIKILPGKRAAFMPRSIVITHPPYLEDQVDSINTFITTLESGGPSLSSPGTKKKRTRSHKKRRVLVEHYPITPPPGPFIGEQLDLLSEAG